MLLKNIHQLDPPNLPPHGADLEKLRKMARQWRTGSKARAAKAGRDLGALPSIDEVFSHLKALPWRCEYCQRALGRRKQNKPNLDHRLPIVRGGTAAVSNLVLACWPCNGSKGPLTDIEFRELLATVASWPDQGNSLLIRLRGGYWTYRELPRLVKTYAPLPEVPEKAKASSNRTDGGKNTPSGGLFE